MTPLLSLTIVLLGSFAAASDTWPGFRGAGDSATAAVRLPVKWSESENIAWKANLPGYGQSSPVVWKDTVFVTAVTGDEREKGFIVAFDLATGKERWRHAFAPTQKAKWSNYISKAAPTPVVDEHGIYAFFEGGNVIALTHDGKERWTRSLVKDYGEFQNNHGLAASPVLTGEAVVILVDDRGPSYLVALDKGTGKNLWKVERPQKGSWTSPVISSARNEIVISSNGAVSGYDLKTGVKRWELDDLSGNTIPSAALAGDRVIVGAGAGKGDAKAALKSNCCISFDKAGKPAIVWQSDKATASMASPLVHRGHVYFVSQAGVAFCLDLESGKERFAERLDASCWATPIAAGENIYFFSKTGVTAVIKAGPAFEIVATNNLWPTEQAAGSILYGVAAVDGALLARSGNTLYRIGK